MTLVTLIWQSPNPTSSVGFVDCQVFMPKHEYFNFTILTTWQVQCENVKISLFKWKSHYIINIQLVSPWIDILELHIGTLSYIDIFTYRMTA